MMAANQIGNLISFKPEKGLVFSFFLDADMGDRNIEAQRIAAKNLLSEVQKNLKDRELSPEEKQQAEVSLQAIQDFLQEELNGAHSYRGLAVFCGPDFWQVYRLPRPVRDGVYVDRTPYVRPVLAILSEYHRILVALVDRRQAKLFDYYMGELNEREHITDDVPGRVRLAGWYGLEERRVRRHIHDHEHQHYKRVADRLFQLLKANQFDKLALGGHESELPVFEEFLHPYVQEVLIGRFAAEPEIKMTPVKQILAEVQRIEQEYKRQEDLRLANEIVEKARAQGLGATGLEATLAALMQGAVYTLAVEEGWSSPGSVCPECGSLMVKAEACGYCGAATRAVDDIIDEVIAYAVDSGAVVRHVSQDTPLHNEGHIGALLRFRIQKQ